MKKLFIILSLVAACGLTLSPILCNDAGAVSIDLFQSTCSGSDSSTCKAQNDDTKKFANNIVNTLMWVIGVTAVVMIIVGGLMYVTSFGDANKVQIAKNIILYSVVGLIVALSAYAIVAFVVSRL
jgi:heme/copper-type cytochrome/quinol oxidase subunit 2